MSQSGGRYGAGRTVRTVKHLDQALGYAVYLAASSIGRSDAYVGPRMPDLGEDRRVGFRSREGIFVRQITIDVGSSDDGGLRSPAVPAAT